MSSHSSSSISFSHCGHIHSSSSLGISFKPEHLKWCQAVHDHTQPNLASRTQTTFFITLGTNHRSILVLDAVFFFFFLSFFFLFLTILPIPHHLVPFFICGT